MKNLLDAGIDNIVLFWINHVGLRQQRKRNVMPSFGHSTRSAVYIMKQDPQSEVGLTLIARRSVTPCMPFSEAKTKNHNMGKLMILIQNE
jgi:hypothetical protein